MRDRIWKHLIEIDRPVSAGEILRNVLGIESPNAAMADRVLRGIIGSDPRFRCARGRWVAVKSVSPATASALHAPVILFLEVARRSAGFRAVRGAVYPGGSQPVIEFLITPDMTGTDRQALERARASSENRALVTWNAQHIRLWNQCLRACGITEWSGQSVALRRLAAAALPDVEPADRPDKLSQALGLPPPDPENVSAMARHLARVLESLLSLVPPDSRDLQVLNSWIEARRPAVDFSHFAFGPELLGQIPELPGVYVMRNRAGNVIYVGKSRNLRRRVRSYFNLRSLKNPKVANIHGQLHSIDFAPTASEVEALLMEMRMIRDFRPSINVQTEIHEQQAAFGRERNLLLLVPNLEGTRAEVYFLREGLFAARQSVPLQRPPSRRFRERVRSIYFATRRRRNPRREPWEAAIVSRWLASNRRRINFVDVDQAGGFEQTIERTADYLLDPEKLSRKVYYR